MDIKQMVNGIGSERRATAAWLPDGSEGWRLANKNTESITVYAEYGEMSWVPYLCVRLTSGEEIRVAARYYEITFEAKDAEIAEAKKDSARELDRMRSEGWMVAVHNDYRQSGERFTFWLFTHPSGRFVKGEGRTDADAIDQCRAAIDEP